MNMTQGEYKPQQTDVHEVQLSKMLFLEGKETDTVGGKWLLLVFNWRRLFHVFAGHTFVKPGSYGRTGLSFSKYCPG